MEQFIQPIQYNVLKEQAKKLVNGLAVTKDRAVVKALKELVEERSSALFPNASTEQSELLSNIVNLTSKEEVELYLEKLKPHVIPFPELTDTTLKKLFPKEKKIKAPVQTDEERLGTTYFCLTDIGSNRKYIVFQHEGELIGRKGSYGNQVSKGICSICNHHEEVTMFMRSTKKSADGNFTKLGNRICMDSKKCNENLTDVTRLYDFLK